jgi:hypothetical protein
MTDSGTPSSASSTIASPSAIRKQSRSPDTVLPAAGPGPPSVDRRHRHVPDSA